MSLSDTVKCFMLLCSVRLLYLSTFCTACPQQCVSCYLDMDTMVPTCTQCVQYYTLSEVDNTCYRMYHSARRSIALL